MKRSIHIASALGAGLPTPPPRWKRKTRIATIVALVAVVTLAIVGWYRGWFSPGPATVFKDSLELANVGRYEEATRNLPAGNRRQFQRDSKLMKEIWSKVTKNQTVETVEITKITLFPPDDDFGTLNFVIYYQDGSKVKGKETISFGEGRWSHGLHDLHDLVLEEEAKAKFSIMDVPLSKQYTTLPGTAIALRLPEGSEWDAGARKFEHPIFNIRIQSDPSPEATFAAYLKRVEGYWTQPGLSLDWRREFMRGNIRCVLFEGDQMVIEGPSRRLMYLVIEEGSHAGIVVARLPKLDNFIQATKESLNSVRWDKQP
jgi:hypothetical protein